MQGEPGASVSETPVSRSDHVAMSRRSLSRLVSGSIGGAGGGVSSNGRKASLRAGVSAALVTLQSDESSKTAKVVIWRMEFIGRAAGR
jgi:hypothetical protein